MRFEANTCIPHGTLDCPVCIAALAEPVPPLLPVTGRSFGFDPLPAPSLDTGRGRDCRLGLCEAAGVAERLKRERDEARRERDEWEGPLRRPALARRRYGAMRLDLRCPLCDESLDVRTSTSTTHECAPNEFMLTVSLRPHACPVAGFTLFKRPQGRDEDDATGGGA